MPESETFSVRVWNKYGYSEPATITLILTNLSFEGIWKEESSDYYDPENPDFLVIEKSGATIFITIILLTNQASVFTQLTYDIG
jgi:hypothetical protein